MNKINFKIAAARGLSLIQSWVPDGKREGDEWVFKNPRRNDQHYGSCKVNMKTGKWSDFATGDKGGDAVSLLAFIRRIKQSEAARIILGDKISDNFSANLDLSSKSKKSIYDENTKTLDSLSILSDDFGLERIVKEKEKPQAIIPFPEEKIEELVIYVSQKWCVRKWGIPTAYYVYRTIDGPWCVTVRYDDKDGKNIIPFYFTKGNKWKSGRPDIGKAYPLYNIEKLKSGDKVLIVEGEKCADIEVDGYTVLTWIGGAKSIHKSDFSVLKDHDVTIWPDADEAGLEAAGIIIKKLSL